MGQRLEPRNPFRRDPFMPTSMPPYDLLCAHRCRSRPLERSKRIEIASSGPLAQQDEREKGKGHGRDEIQRARSWKHAKERIEKERKRQRETERERAVESTNACTCGVPQNAIVLVHYFKTWKVHEGKVHDYVNEK